MRGGLSQPRSSDLVTALAKIPTSISLETMSVPPEHTESAPRPLGSAIALGQRILGVDPGLHITGYAVVEIGLHRPLVCEAGVIRTAEGRTPVDMAQRVRTLYDSILGVLD